jgi:hypothetical protein
METLAPLNDNSSTNQGLSSKLDDIQQLPKDIRNEASYYANEGNIEKTTQLFETWSSYPDYIILKRMQRGSFKNEWVLVKASKRGNDVYQHRIKKRFQNISSDVVFFDYKNRSINKKTKAIFISLTYAREDLSLPDAWIKSSDDFNTFLTKLRKKYPKCAIIRVNEAHKDGFIHIHVLLHCEHEFNAFSHRGKNGRHSWRISESDEIKQLWPHGFVDVKAVSDLKNGVKYLTKYMLKSVRDNRTLALNWVFNKRQYSISRNWGDLIYPLHNSNIHHYYQVDLFGKCIDTWSLTGFCGGFSLDDWSISISLKELRLIKGTSTYREYIQNAPVNADLCYEYQIKLTNKKLGLQVEVWIRFLIRARKG